MTDSGHYFSLENQWIWNYCLLVSDQTPDEAVILAYDNVDFFRIPELHNQKYDRKRGYSTSSTPKNSTKNTENKVSPSDGPRKKRAAAISAGEEKKCCFKCEIFLTQALLVLGS